MLKSKLWLIGLVVSLLVAFPLVWYVIPLPVWWAACLGWTVSACNSMAARMIHVRAIGSARGAFVGWGLVINSLRMLTIFVIFAYILFFFKEERGTFLVSGFSGFFVMRLVEVAELFWLQDKVGNKV
ncbi:MAG: hypothetical protein WCO42_06600 [bacterium]